REPRELLRADFRPDRLDRGRLDRDRLPSPLERDAERLRELRGHGARRRRVLPLRGALLRREQPLVRGALLRARDDDPRLRVGLLALAAWCLTARDLLLRELDPDGAPHAPV